MKRLEINTADPIGPQLKNVRKMNRMTLVQLAKEMGTDAPHLSRTEKNGTNSLELIQSYLKVFGVKEIIIKL
jgi:transcriptional regulator with XRE-family HTH domain